MMTSVLIVTMVVSLQSAVLASENGSIEIGGYIESGSGNTMCHIIYDANGGKGGYTGADIASGEADTILPLNDTGIVYADFDFYEWNTEAEGNGICYKPGDKITLYGDITLYAQWTATAKTTALESTKQTMVSGSAKTGDLSSIAVWVTVFSVSLVILGTMFSLVYRKQDK